MGAKPKIDWEHAFDEYLTVYKPKGMKQKDYAVFKGVQPAWLSTRFNEIENERLMEVNKARMPKLLSMGLDVVEDTLQMKTGFNEDEPGTGISDEFKAKFGLEAVKAMSDRLGMSPQAVTLNVQQVNQNKTLIALPSMFSNAENQSELKSLLQGELKQDDPIQ